MAKISRFYQRLFGSTATSGQVRQFGSLAASAPLTTTDPATIQALSQWLDGWAAATLGLANPTREDTNAVDYIFARQLGYILQAGVPEWETNTIYYIGSIVNAAGVLYVSLTDANTGNAVTSATNWKLLNSGAWVAKSADYTLTSLDGNVEFDATAAARVATLPAASAANKLKKYTITKSDSSVNQVKITGGVVDYFCLAQYDSITVFSNGTVWYQV